MKLPVAPPPTQELLRELLSSPAGREKFTNGAISSMGPTTGGKYRHWDTFRHIEIDDGLSTQERWLAVKIARQSLYQLLPLVDKKGQAFRYALPGQALEMLHLIDRDASGSIRTSEQVTNPQTRDTYLIKSLVEEAITSSQLEGASTTRQVAKDMLRAGREPTDRSERMILNNYRAMHFVRELLHEDLTPDMVLELQRILTDGTLDNPDAAGRTRALDEPIHVTDEIGTILHVPPNAEELDARLRAMCDFANSHNPEPFIHPVVRAIALHFWLAYDHPFVDGNGRTARALFYWAMARDGYWLCEYISISRILKRARGKYARSFLYTETDENDLTYFLLAQLGVIRQAIKELHEFLVRKQDEMRRTEEFLRRDARWRQELNPRQLALLNHALKKPDAAYSVESHRRSHNISYETSRSDLTSLVKRGLLTQSKQGRMFWFRASKALVSARARPLEQR
jgi:Fic family protein